MTTNEASTVEAADRTSMRLTVVLVVVMVDSVVLDSDVDCKDSTVDGRVVVVVFDCIVVDVLVVLVVVNMRGHN